ncbi:MAG: DUF433 domain-containing protein [Deltaproteobacteria bacterium]|nr:DUF433 domain-containing protein [Deltaproteobacteria bacterium]MBW1872736.1 DUF433 domain-containing protein [Deltaproteobacteria bacterium]
MDIYGGRSPLSIPLYSFLEAARYIGMPQSTLRAWVFGQKFPKASGSGFFKPLIELDAEPQEPNHLSFTNLIEAQVLAAMRRTHGVSMTKVRNALAYLYKHFDMDHPLASHEFETDGVDIFISELGALISVSDSGQTAMREAIKMHLERIERDDDNVAVRLYPFIRSVPKPDEPKVIVIDPRVSFGRPVLVGTGIPVETIVDRFHAGESLSELSNDYSCETKLLEEAIRCALPKAA